MRYPRALDASPSFRFVWLIAAIHLVAALSLIYLWRQPLWLAAGMLALVVLLSASLFHWRRRRGETWVLGDDGVLIVRRAGIEREARLAGPATDFGWAVWVVLREQDRRLRSARMLLRADFVAEDWRALGLWLRHKARATDDAPLSAA
ncbi:YgfX family protein [Pseudazoarcus pumilus]|uniref:Toxin CptA n=1 Tax=Pseudazoarcus pumilus TaxID=2067960 RepID=A0A2I6S541_9RHOO|nr:protein YgfX [Pseudazoarcus pumilus]AUN94373.1 hypothetical protein C0099_05120 [Pseudazoarcus pumilus]